MSARNVYEFVALLRKLDSFTQSEVVLLTGKTQGSVSRAFQQCIKAKLIVKTAAQRADDPKTRVYRWLESD